MHYLLQEMTAALAKYEPSLHFAMELLNSQVSFIFHSVTSAFCPTSCFSSVDFLLEAYTDKDGRYRMAMSINKLFKVKVEEKHIDALKFIDRSRSNQWPPIELTLHEHNSDKAIMLSVNLRILMPLCREVILEKAYQGVLVQQRLPTANIKCQSIGMGSVYTWHGTPDIRVRGTEVVCRRGNEHELELEDEVLGDDGSDGGDSGSDGAATTVEGKVRFKDANLCQAIAMCCCVIH